VRRLLPLLLALSVAALGSCSLTLWNYSNIVTRHYALVYGVTIYDDNKPAGKYPNLNYPGSDASAVASMLTAEGYDVTSRLVDASGNVIWDGHDEGALSGPGAAFAPTKANLAVDLQAMGSLVGADDVFVFYFSGHGMQVTSPTPVEYFVPEGGVVADAGNTATSVSDSEFGAMLAPISSKRKVVILDTCNSGGFIGNSLEADAIPAASLGSSGGISLQALAQALGNFLNFPTSTSGLSPYGGAMVLSAAGSGEFCYETSTFGHGVMTYFLIQAPQSGDLNHDGHVTVGEAFSLVKAGIETDWNSNSSVQADGETFEPRISGGPVDFVLW
jgi:Caspase domain